MLAIPSLRQSIGFLLLGDFFLLPFAHLKLSFCGLPFYTLEIPILIALFLFLLEYFFSSPVRKICIPTDRYMLLGIALFLLGAILSCIANPFSWTGLGMIKSWFLIPFLGAFLWQQTNQKNTRRLFVSWALSSIFIALGGLWFLVRGTLTYDSRLEAWYTSPNFLAILVAPGIIIITSFFQHHHSQKKQGSISLFLTCLSLILLSLILFFTHSYTVWIATFFSLLFFFSSLIFKEKSSKKILLVGLLLIASSVFIFFESGTEKWHSFLSFEKRSSLASRMMIWHAAGKIIVDHPIIGIGVGRFEEEYLAYQKYFPPYLEWAVPEPHNLLLAVWLETGVIGLIGGLLFIWHFLQALYRNIFLKQMNENKKMSSRLILSLLLLFLFYGLTDTPYFKNDLAFLFWMLIASGAPLITNQSDTDAS